MGVSQETRLTTDPTAPRPAKPPERALKPEHIEQLMAQPIPERPQITVFGDDAVTGINPPPAPP